MRYRLLGLLMMLCTFTAAAQVSISIGINLPAYPVLQRVPGYPVYYAPRLDSNYFFYDGLYWIYDNDNWYASSWYNGPWALVDRFDVPVYLLRVPVRYYRRAPVYFQGWRHDAPPRWGEYWGPTWQQRRSGWDRWNRSSAPAPAPLPVYQRQYSGDRYPRATQEQAAIQTRSYRYQPREAVVRQQYERIRAQAPAAPRAAQAERKQQQRVDKRLDKQEQRVEKRAEQQDKRVEKRAEQQDKRVEKRAEQQERRSEKRAEQQDKRVEKRAEQQERRSEKRDKDDKDDRGKGRDR